jgi:hypothetical protein
MIKKEDRKLSDSERKQREEAPLKHGVYRLRDHGPSALDPEQRGKYAELQDQLSTRQGAIEALKEQATQAMLLAEIAQSYCVTQYKAGKCLDDIALLRALPAFWNSANRALKTYLDVLPKDDNRLDLGEAITKAVELHEQNKK